MDYQTAVKEILDSAKRSIEDKTSITIVFEASGIEIDSDLNFSAFMAPPELCLQTLMDKLRYLPALRVPAQRILRKQGIMFDVIEIHRLKLPE